jgi:single-stranded-DNA-specific exonuclease
MAAGEGWHPGVIGIVAGRLKERYNRPACVVALDGEVGKGSGRSIAGLDLGNAVIAARQAGLLVNGGGHAMAAGFTVEAGRIGALRDFLEERLAAAANGPIVPSLTLDGTITAAAAVPELALLLDRLGPFGTGNPEPRFAIPDLRVLRGDVVGESHVRVLLAGSDGARLKAIAFRQVESDIGRALLCAGGTPLHVAGHLRADNWQGQAGIQLIIDDVAPALVPARAAIG